MASSFLLLYRSFRCLTLAQRANTAFLALSLRSWGVMFAARAGPPLRPPLRPSATAYGFFRFRTMILLYVSAYEGQVHVFLAYT